MPTGRGMRPRRTAAWKVRTGPARPGPRGAEIGGTERKPRLCGWRMSKRSALQQAADEAIEVRRDRPARRSHRPGKPTSSRSNAVLHLADADRGGREDAHHVPRAQLGGEMGHGALDPPDKSSRTGKRCQSSRQHACARFTLAVSAQPLVIAHPPFLCSTARPIHRVWSDRHPLAVGSPTCPPSCHIRRQHGAGGDDRGSNSSAPAHSRRI